VITFLNLQILHQPLPVVLIAVGEADLYLTLDVRGRQTDLLLSLGGRLIARSHQDESRFLSSKDVGGDL
jgi:hypothetical protein